MTQGGGSGIGKVLRSVPGGDDGALDGVVVVPGTGETTSQALPEDHLADGTPLAAVRREQRFRVAILDPREQLSGERFLQDRREPGGAAEREDEIAGIEHLPRLARSPLPVPEFR